MAVLFAGAFYWSNSFHRTHSDRLRGVGSVVINLTTLGLGLGALVLAWAGLAILVGERGVLQPAAVHERHYSVVGTERLHPED